MQLATIWQHVHKIQQEIKQGTREAQDTAIVALQDCLDESGSVLFPSFVYPQLTEVLHFYSQKVLPEMGLSREDLWIVRESFEQTLCHSQVQEKTAKSIEAQIKQFFLDVKSGKFEMVNDIVAALWSVVRHEIVRSEVRSLPPSKRIEKYYRTLKKSPFTTSSVIPFFETLIKNLPEEVKETFASIKDLFWHQLNDLLQMKAVLVNTKSLEAIITRLDITATLDTKGLDTLNFESNIDNRMYNSCWNAIQAARGFLEEHFPDILKNQVICVTCRFPNLALEYNDTSASLLMALKVIGDVLDMEVNPHVVVTGEVDESGKIVPVSCTAEKVAVADGYSEIQHFFLPANGLFVQSNRITITEVQTLFEVVEHYYGEQFLKKKRQISRRQVLKGAVALAAVPLGLFTFRNVFTHPVTDQDIWNLEYAQELYQKQSQYQKAIQILNSILKKFVYKDSTSEILQLKAQVFGHLGLIHMQQHNTKESLIQLQKAFDLWQSLHAREEQFNTLLDMSGVYYYAATVDGNRKAGEISLQYINQAKKVLTPSMKTFKESTGYYYGHIGSCYYGLEEYEMAQTCMEKSVAWLEGTEASWSYYHGKQYAGRILNRLGEYDKAYPLLESTLYEPVLQRPYNQVRAFESLSDLFLSTGEREKGIEFALRTQRLCTEYGLKTQQTALRKMLARHNVSPVERNLMS